MISTRDSIKNRPKPVRHDVVSRIDLEFSHPNEIEAATDWNVDFKQLEPGPSRTNLTLQASQDVFLAGIVLSGRLHQQGTPPPGWSTFGIVDTKTETVWQNAPVEPNSLLHFGARDGFDSISGAGHDGVIFSVPQELLSTFAQSVGAQWANPEGRTGVFKGAERGADVDRFASRIRRLLKRSDVHWSPALKEALLLELLRIVGDIDVRFDKSALSNRQRAMQRAIDFMHETDDMTLRVSDLCDEVASTWRTLDRAFKEHFGLGPKAYFNRLRLNRVRHALIRDKGQQPIGNIANQYDFWHMGQFAKDYKALFGELPSDTAALRRQIRVTPQRY